MWPSVQRVPSQSNLRPDSAERSAGPGTPAMDGHTANGHSASGDQQLPNGAGNGAGSSAGGPHERAAPNSGGGGGDDGAGSSSGSEAGEAEEVPQVEVQMIPLSMAVGRLITYAYTELVTLVDTLPSRGEADRRAEILRYTEHMSDLLTKLLVLVRWAKNAPQIQKCQNVIAFLDSQNRYFEYAVDSIYATFLSMPNVRVRNYDVPNAVDILSTGTYRRLPLAIKRAVPPPPLSREMIQQTLAAIDGIIRGRILRGEPIPLAMRQYTVANGRIVFTVPKEFRATLTLLQFEAAIPWHVVGVEVLVSGSSALSDEQQVTINTRQIVDRAQHILIEASSAVAAQEPGHTAAPSTPPPQLAQLYDFLHRQCFTVLLETILKQATVLRHARWENLLHVEMGGSDRSVLTLKYWTSPRAAGSAAVAGESADRGNSIVFRLVVLPVPRPIHASAIEGPDALGALPRGSSESAEFLSIEQDRRNLIPKIGLSVTWTARSGLREPQVSTRRVLQIHELAEPVKAPSGFSLMLDAEAVDTERLLRQVTWRHSRTILESLHASMEASGLFGEDAVELLYVTPSGATQRVLDRPEEEEEEEGGLSTVTPVLRAWYRQGEGAVDISVDMYTGRLVVRASEAMSMSTSLSESMIGQLADQLNRTPWRVAGLLVDMRSSLALADLDCLVYRSLGLRSQTAQGARPPVLPGFALSGASQRADVGNGQSSHYQPAPSHTATPVSASAAPAAGFRPGAISPAMSGASSGFQQPQQAAPPTMATNFPLRISQQEADALMRDVAGADNPLGRVRFYMVEGTEGVEDLAGAAPGGSARGEWYIMVAMTDRLRFRLVLLCPHPTDRLLCVVSQIISLQVDRLFSSVARRLLVERHLSRAPFAQVPAGAKRKQEGADGGASSTSSGFAPTEREITERVDAMLSGRTSITLDYLNALASACRARLAVRLLQTQLTRWRIPYSFRLPSFSTSPHGHRAAVSRELSVVELDRMGLYELDEQVPMLYIPILGLMRASPINWSVVNQGVLPDEARRMVSVRIASDELDPSPRADLSSSTRVDQHRQAAIAEMEGRAQPFAAPHARSSYAAAAAHAAGHSLIGRHIIPCQVIASIPVALDGLPGPVSRAYADAVHFGAHAEVDGGYHRKDGDSEDARARGGYSKVVLVYRQVNRALQCLIRDWSEQHLMTHVGRHMYVWEQRALRRVLSSTTAFYPFSAGPYTREVASMLGSWRGHQSAELVVQCIGSCFVSISCRVPYPWGSEDAHRSTYPPGFGDFGGSDLSFHLTLADVDSKTNRIRRVASTWPWVFSHSVSGRASFEVSTSLSRWLRTLQAQLNLTGNPLTALSMIVQMMPIHHIVESISSVPVIHPLVPSLQADSRESLIRFQVKDLLGGGNVDKENGARVEDRSYMLIQKLSAVPKDISQAFRSVRGLHVMHMYTAADNIRLVFNSRYVVDLHLVASNMFHISDAVGSAATLKRQHQQSPRGGFRGASSGSSGAPEPLVTATTEPIPLFGDWLEALAQGMKLDWGKMEQCMSVLMQDAARLGADSKGMGAREKVRLFQRNMFALRPGASKAECLFHHLRQTVTRQSSARSPAFLLLAPSTVVCTRLHLVPVLRSLMQWLVQSVHVRDQLEMAILRTQELLEPPPAGAADGAQAKREPLLGIKEKLVFMSDRETGSSADGTATVKQVMIVGFTGARESVRCEFLVQSRVVPSSKHTYAEPDARPAATTGTTGPAEADEGVFGEADENAILSVMSDAFTIPEDLMHADLDVRIVPLTRPPNGITEAAASFLVGRFKAQTSDIRQRAGTLVRVLALPPQLVMDIVDTATKLSGKVDMQALSEGIEHHIRMDAEQQRVYFTTRVSKGAEWTTVGIEYLLLTGSARVVFVVGPNDDGSHIDENLRNTQSDALMEPWSMLMDQVITKLDQQTAFTRDMGKSGKSRWFDIVSGLHEAHQAAA